MTLLYLVVYPGRATLCYPRAAHRRPRMDKETAQSVARRGCLDGALDAGLARAAAEPSWPTSSPIF